MGRGYGGNDGDLPSILGLCWRMNAIGLLFSSLYLYCEMYGMKKIIGLKRSVVFCKWM